MNEYFNSIDDIPIVSELYSNIDSQYKINNLDISYFDYKRDGHLSCPRLKAVWSLLCDNFNLYYATREIGGYSEYDFYSLLQSCLNRNADTFERQLAVYDDDIANPILGRTEKVTYDTKDDRSNTGSTQMNHGLSTTRVEGGNDILHHIEVPADLANYDTDRSKDKTEYGRRVTDTNSGIDINTLNLADNRAVTGTITTELSDLGVRPNYESLNGFLDKNRTFIQEFIDKFDECFSPRYHRIYF